MNKRPALSNEELTDVLVNYFTREIINQRIILDDIPELIREYLPQDVIQQATRHDDGEFVETLEYHDVSEAEKDNT